MAIYSATYNTNVIVGQDGYSPIEVGSSGSMSYNDFITAGVAGHLFVYGIVVYAESFDQLHKTFGVYESDANGRAINYTSIINPDTFKTQNIGVAEFERFEIAHSNYIDYSINPNESIIFDVFFSDAELEKSDRQVAVDSAIETQKLDYIYDYKEFPDFSNHVVKAFMGADMTNDMIHKKNNVIINNIENGLNELIDLDKVIKNATSYKTQSPFVVFVRLFIN